MEKTCDSCPATITGERASKRRCDECQRSRARARQRERYVPADKSRTCETCSTSFESRNPARWCPECRKKRQAEQIKAWAQDPVNRERRLEYNRNGPWQRNHTLRQYGLDAAGYDELLAKQGGVCAVCSPCNRGIGMLGDNADGVRAALVYLERQS